MKKYIFLFFFLILINFSLTNEFDLYNIIESFYDYLPKIVKGYVQDEGQCADVFSKEKQKFLEIIKEVLEKINNGKDLISAVISSMPKIFQIENFTKYCNALAKLPATIIFSTDSPSKIENFGFTLIKHAKNITKYINEFENTKDLECTGKILKEIF